MKINQPHTHPPHRNFVLSHSVPHWHCVLSGGIQRRAFCLGARVKKILTLINNSLKWGSNPQPSRYIHTLVPLHHDGLIGLHFYILFKIHNYFSKQLLL